jgi:hypothetical protein
MQRIKRHLVELLEYIQSQNIERYTPLSNLHRPTHAPTAMAL